MTNALNRDLQKLETRAYDRAEWAEQALRRYHAVAPSLNAAALQQLQGPYNWMFVPSTLWPFNIQDLLEGCLALLEKGKCLSSQCLLLLDLLPEPPNEIICAAVAEHEHHVQTGAYENLVKTQAKYAQNERAISADPELRSQWQRIKAAFDVQAFCDHKGVIRRTMGAERNLRPSFSIDVNCPEAVFRAAFDAFCLRWNLYGMKNDTPLVLKLSVNITPYGTMIHIPAYWSFDPRRDIRWDAIACLHRVRVSGRQGATLAEGLAERRRAAEKLRHLDKEVLRLGYKGAKKHEFLCEQLGWHPDTSPKRISRLRAEFKLPS